MGKDNRRKCGHRDRRRILALKIHARYRKEMVVLKKIKKFLKNDNALAVVEAAILFPVMFMIFFALVMLSMYLPQRAILQEAAQYAVTMLAPERSDAAYRFDDKNIKIREPWDFKMHNSFSDVFAGAYDAKNNFWSRTFSWYRNAGDWQARVNDIVQRKISNSITLTAAPVHTEVEFRQTMLYAEITVTVWQEIPIPVNFSFIGFPNARRIERSARGAVFDGDGFIRTVDDAEYYKELVDRRGAILGDIAWGLKYILPFIN